MIYVWVDLETGKEVEVDRPMSGHKEVPTQEEAEMTDEEYKAAKWEKQISGGSATIGFGMKGHW